MLRKQRRDGFTLVEILIVIVFIGILAGVMLPVVGKAQAKARATKIVSNMRTIQKAAMMYYADHGVWFPEENLGKKWDTGQDTGAFLVSYLDGELATDLAGLGTDKQFFVYYNNQGDGDRKYYVVCNVFNGYEDYATRLALEPMCSSPPFCNGHMNTFVAQENPAEWDHNGQVALLIADKGLGND